MRDDDQRSPTPWPRAAVGLIVLLPLAFVVCFAVGAALYEAIRTASWLVAVFVEVVR